MNTQDESAAPDVSGQTEPVKQATEQTTEKQPLSYAQQLLAEAEAEGYEVGPPQPKAEAEPEPEAEPEKPESEEVLPETGDKPETEEKPEEPKEEESEEEKVAAKKGDEWPDSAKQRVAEETAKRKRANDRADKAEALAMQLQQQLAQASAPVPTEDNPFIDVQDVNTLDRLERSYEKTIDLADENPEGAEDILVGRNPDGSEIRKDFTAEQLSMLKRKAEKAIRKQIPERRTYLQQRAVNDAQALEMYPELKDPESELAKVTSYFMQKILTGEAQRDPTLAIYCGHAAKQYLASLQRNGKETPAVKSPEAKKVIESARQKLAPTPTKTRSLPESRSSSSELARAKKEAQERGYDEESADKLIGTILASRGRANKLERVAE